MKKLFRDSSVNEKEVLNALENADSIIYDSRTKVVSLYSHEGLIFECINVDNMNIKQLANNCGIYIVSYK